MAIPSPTIEFLARLKKIDNEMLTCRDILVLWAVAREPGMMGRQLALKLGYKTRSNIQLCVARLIRHKLMEDRRQQKDHMTPNDLYITPAGETLLAEIVPV
jgi:hypothetical protein